MRPAPRARCQPTATGRPLAAGRAPRRVSASTLDGAPAGKDAVVDALKRPSKLGTVKVHVRQDESVRARVKLTESGLRRLKRHGKLKVTLRLIVDLDAYLGSDLAGTPITKILQFAGVSLVNADGSTTSAATTSCG